MAIDYGRQRRDYSGGRGTAGPDDDRRDDRRGDTRDTNAGGRGDTRGRGEDDRQQDTGGGRSGGKGEFVNITGFFPSKSGKADTVFMKQELVDKLRQIQAGDTLGVSVNQKTHNLSLWCIKKR